MRKTELIEFLISDFKSEYPNESLDTLSLLKSHLIRLDIQDLELLAKSIPLCIVIDRSKFKLPPFYQAAPDLKTAYKFLKNVDLPFQIITMR